MTTRRRDPQCPSRAPARLRGPHTARHATLPLVLVLACLVGSPSRAATFETEPRQVVLGRVESAQVTFRIDEPPGTEARPLRLSVNVGSFGPVTRLKAGVYQSVFFPENRSPRSPWSPCGAKPEPPRQSSSCASPCWARRRFRCQPRPTPRRGSWWALRPASAQ